MPTTVAPHAINTSSRRSSTRAAFFVAGFAMGAWAPLVPYAQHRLQLDSGSLGLLLLCLGSGSLISMLFSGRLAGRFGCRAVIIAGSLMVCFAFPFLATAESIGVMILSLALFGAGVGLTDVTVNIQGALIEQTSTKPLMSGFHGLFSIGGIVGAAGGSIALSSGLSPMMMSIAALSVIVLVMFMVGKHLLPFATHAEAEQSRFRLHPRLLLMALMCMTCFLAEGAMLDWSGIWLTSERGLSLDHAGWGYATFAVAMAIMRLMGDRLISAVGRRKLLILSGICAMSGYTLAVLLPGWETSLAAFILVGIGAANVAPVVTTLAGLEKIMPSNMSVAFVSTVGYLGILMGPAVIGFIAHLSSLAAAFIFIAISLLIVVLGALKLR
ncbi:MFS transporter [Tatumella ptyseos]|uniref:MFS transporter n=1 Tax=Tatumella ptyseos TaxID=82987 RepID=UPI0026F109D9|nr:MFS transporter [Tatumella ptyseos]WKX25422.1 MFS transporter [Tatumella ptyseos]